MDERALERLIEDLAPLNNKYRMAVRNHEPVHKAIGYLWDIGEVLLRNGVDKVHPIAQQIQERSYITANLLSYAYRVSRNFKDRRSIRRNFGKVPNFSLFREAFPLLENPRYRLNQKEKREIVRLLNSGAVGKEITARLVELKREKLPVRNARSEGGLEIRPFAEMFKERLRVIEAIMEKASLKRLHAFRAALGPEFLLFLNRLALCLAEESFPPKRVAPDGKHRQIMGGTGQGHARGGNRRKVGQKQGP